MLPRYRKSYETDTKKQYTCETHDAQITPCKQTQSYLSFYVEVANDMLSHSYKLSYPDDWHHQLPFAPSFHHLNHQARPTFTPPFPFLLAAACLWHLEYSRACSSAASLSAFIFLFRAIAAATVCALACLVCLISVAFISTLFTSTFAGPACSTVFSSNGAVFV